VAAKPDGAIRHRQANPVAEDEAPRSVDLATIAAQLGRAPHAVAGIARRCARGCPAVITTAPVVAGDDGDELFPTLYWVTCPQLAVRLARLEADGWLARVRHLLDNDMAFAGAQLDAHQQYAELRRRALGRKATHRLRAGAADLAAVIDGTGVGGTRQTRHVKCLHAHYAHWLATGCDPIGALTDTWLRASPAARCRLCGPVEGA
jgi:hypothetical protein